MICPKSCSLALIVALAVAALAHVASASPYIGTGQFFVDPAGWNIGAAGSTYQAWDNFPSNPPGPPSTSVPPKAPDAGLVTNPVLGSGPTVSGSAAPGTFIFVTASGNIYSPMGNYTLNANIPNHGTGGGNGTHVIVQTASSLGDPPVSVIDNTLQIVDLSNNPIAGGENSSALVNSEVLAAGVVDSTMGPVNYEVLIWEFFLPNYTGDFRVQWSEGIHSSFDQLRVDSFIAPTALALTPFTFQQIPEPSTLVIAFLGLAGLMAGRRCH